MSSSSPSNIEALPPGSPPEVDAAQAWVSMRHVQRAVVFMMSSGMDREELLREGGLTSEQLNDVDRKVPLRDIEAILLTAMYRYRDPLMGLHMAEDIQPATLGALGHLLQACGTLGELMNVATRFNGLMSNIGHTALAYSPGKVEMRWYCLSGSPMMRRQACEYIIGVLAVMGRLLVPGRPRAMSIQFPHSRPEQPEHARAYFDFFGCPVYFDQPHASIIMPASTLQMPLPHGDAVLKELLERHAQLLLSRRAEPPLSVIDDVRRLLRSMILAGTPTKEAVATQLGTSTRSLHRRLEEAGTSYGEQLDAVRLELAREQLQAMDTPISDITERLGFSSPQAFMRWFRQQVGVTPSQYRSGLAADEAASLVMS